MDAARASKSANARDMARAVLFRFFTSCLIGVGFGAYLLLNRIVTGDPFTFLLYQRQHWSQSFGSLHNTLRYTMNNAFEYGDAALRLGTWIPQVLSILLAIVLLLVTVRRISPGDGAYALLYIYIASAPTWLLSGTRYLGAMYTVYPMLTLLSGRRWAYWLLAGTSVLALAYITYHYAVVGTVL